MIVKRVLILLMFSGVNIDFFVWGKSSQNQQKFASRTSKATLTAYAREVYWSILKIWAVSTQRGLLLCSVETKGIVCFYWGASVTRATANGIRVKNRIIKIIWSRIKKVQIFEKII